ncbi:MAG TPA: DUF1801 domain-containing protein, partial [Paraburkholderia sp.]
MNPKVDAYLDKEEKWQHEFRKLRAIILDCGLTETLKWGKPCYAVEDGNVVLIHGFKAYCALLFFKGALLEDPEGILIAQSENTQSARQIRFTSVQQIAGMEDVLKSYIRAAIEAEKAGLKVSLKKTEDFNIPEEFSRKL